MKSSILRYPLLLLFGLLVISSLVKQTQAKDTKNLSQFGLYNLVKGQDNPICSAVGEQIKNYKRVPFAKGPNRKRYFLLEKKDFETANTRCDYPIQNIGIISVPLWQNVELFSRENLKSGQGLGLLRILFSEFYRSSSITHEGKAVEIDDETQLVIIRRAQSELVDYLASLGLMKMQKAEIEFASNGKQNVYRLNFPNNPNEQQCWHIAFDRESPFHKIWKLSFPLNGLFQSNGKTYTIVDTNNAPKYGDETLSVLSFDYLASIGDEEMGFAHHETESVCDFALSREVRK